MYWNGLVVIGIDRLLCNFESIIVFFLELILLAGLMRYADYIYLHHANKKIAQGVLKSGINKPLLIILMVLLVITIGYFLTLLQLALM